ncbi:hypothetical protein JZO77_03510 [Enterococcus hulanensis]|uniref:hypothetical protein n=1 Tax=Enterococcus hulanensis TaxID=2559929 RepID=UPI001A8F2621|nr:hypothetical protein [Enterococcus hulanensis]MBO0455806.1 hypothetical protein [Enterococcus hulanensis]
MIKKAITFVVVGGAATAIIKEGYNYVQELRETKKSIDQMERLLDPFVEEYNGSENQICSFQKIIKEKLTTEDVQSLRKILKHRYQQLSYIEGSFSYLQLIEAIDECLPVVGSITDVKNRFTS